MFSPSADFFKKYASEKTFSRIKDYKTISEMWKSVITEFADDDAINYDGIQYTYKTIENDVASIRGVLQKKGLKKGDRVCLFAPNSYDFVKGFLAITTSGMCAVILPAHLDEMSVFGCTMIYGASALLASDMLSEKLGIAKAKNVNIIMASEKADSTADIVVPNENDECVVMFTGGTTGKSKGALLSNGAVMQGTINGCYGYDNVFSQRYLLVLPLSHVFGLIRNLMTSLYTGSNLLICKNNKDMFRDIAMFKPTILVVVPAIAEMALNLSKQFGKNMLGESIKTVICGAAAVAPYLVKEYKKMGVGLFPGYGLTESANLVSGNPDSADHPDSVGIMYPNQEYKLVDGELWLKGKNMMLGYIGVEGETPYEDGWFKTGDLVRFDDEGYMYITGRIKEIIVLSNGENVSPAEVEAHFNELEFIQDSQVFEDVDENGTHFLSLEVVPRATVVAKLDAEDKNAYIMSELNRVNMTLLPYERVSKIVIRDTDFARTPSMKIARYKKCQ